MARPVSIHTCVGVLLLVLACAVATTVALSQNVDEDKAVQAHHLLEEARATVQQDDCHRAIGLFGQALSAFQEVLDRFGEANSQLGLGECYFEIGEEEQAVSHAKLALAISKAIGEIRLGASCMMLLGRIYLQTANYRLSIEYTEQALSMFQVVGDHFGEADALASLGHCYMAVDDYGMAIGLYEQASSIFHSLGDRRAEARSVMDKGSCLASVAQVHKAIRCYQNSLTIFQTLGDTQDEAACLKGLGSCYSMLSDFEQAITLGKQALRLFEDTGDLGGKADALLMLSNAYLELADYQQAVDRAREALHLFQAIGVRLGEAGSLQQIGTCYATLGALRVAMYYFREALGIFRLMSALWGEADCLTSLGLSSLALGDATQAIAYHQQALAICRETGKRLGEAGSLHALGDCFLSMDNVTEAIHLYEQSISIFRDVGERAAEASALLSIGQCYERFHQLQTAISYYKQAFSLAHEVGATETSVFAQWSLGRAYWDLRDLAHAEEHYRLALRSVEMIRKGIEEESLRQSFLSNLEDLYHEYITLLIELGEEGSTLWIVERCRARTFLDLLAKGPVGTIENIAEEGIRSGVVEASAIKADVDEVVASLPPDTAALEYFVTDRVTYVWMVEDRKINGPIIINHSGQELMDEVINCREKLDAGQEAANHDLAILYDWLIRPVQNLLPGTTGEGDVPHLIIIPSGPLYYLPFQALIWTSKDLSERAPVIQRYALSYSPSLATLKYAQALRDTAYPKATFLGLADPDSGDSSIPRLPDTQTEARSVAKLFPVSSVYVDKDATEDVIQSHSATQREILLSTHGSFNPHNPMFSYLVMSPTTENKDAKLFAYEVFSLPLHADMVVLSACETLLPSLEEMTSQLNRIARRAGDNETKELTEDQLKELTAGDEVVGLTRAFISAGASSVLSSLWSVPSESTTQLMVSFYEHMAEGMDKAHALRAAQLEVMNSIGCTQPWYWAAFNLMGDWR